MPTSRRPPRVRIALFVALSLVWKMKARWPESTEPYMVVNPLEEISGVNKDPACTILDSKNLPC
jgi:hypothetical protein